MHNSRPHRITAASQDPRLDRAPPALGSPAPAALFHPPEDRPAPLGVDGRIDHGDWRYEVTHIHWPFVATRIPWQIWSIAGFLADLVYGDHAEDEEQGNCQDEPSRAPCESPAWTLMPRVDSLGLEPTLLYD